MAVLLALKLRRGALAWGWSRIVLGAGALAGMPGLTFARALGSGHEGGFGLRPSLDRQGLFALFDDETAARAFIAGSAPMAAYRAHADELVVTLLRATSCRGSWGGHAIGISAPGAETGQPVAALTRASIRPTRAAAFWRHAAPAQAALIDAAGCRFAVGLGEAPLLRQATFSLWSDTAAMDAYARQGAHAAAIRGALQGGWFAESMFARFEVLELQGRWKGQHLG